MVFFKKILIEFPKEYYIETLVVTFQKSQVLILLQHIHEKI